MKFASQIFLVFGLLVFGALADEDEEYEAVLYRDAVEFVTECGSKELSLCFKERALKYLDNLPNNFDFGGGIRIKENYETARSSKHHNTVTLSKESRARENELDNIIVERLADYVTTHTFEIKLPSETTRDFKRSVEEGRKKKNNNNNNNKGMMNMMMLIQLKAAVLGALALKVVALIAFKALLVAKVALTIASVIALKKLLEQKHHTSTYEVVAHPHYEDHSHFDRSFSQELAYNGQKTNFNN